jgi:hypothetical protein
MYACMHLQALSNPPSNTQEELVNGLIRHFMQLFDCSSIDRVYATMSKAYMTMSEHRNFVRGLADLIRAPQDSSLAVLMAAVQSALGAGEGSSRPTQIQPQDSPGPPLPATTVGTAQEEAAERLQQVASILGARGLGEAVSSAERLVDRLRRLDQVLPRYISVKNSYPRSSHMPLHTPFPLGTSTWPVNSLRC